MMTQQPDRPVARRTALAGLGAIGLGAVLAARGTRTVAQEATPTAMATHPIVGTWLNGRTPNDLAVVHWDPDGNMTGNGPIFGTGPDGAPTYGDIPMGTWEPVSDRGIHFTFTFATYDAAGARTGSVTVEGYPAVGDDGQSFWDEATEATVTLRDATGAVTQVIGEGAVPAIGGVRMTPGRPGYDEMLALLATRGAGTPEAGTPAP